MVVEAPFGRHLMMVVDVRGYGSGSDQRQAEIQRDLSQILDAAAERAALHRNLWKRQPAGDGELALLPDSEPEPRLVDDFVRQLAYLVNLRNGDQVASRLQLRLAINHGVGMAAPFGSAGQGPVRTARLADSAEAHRALEESGADLVVILSRGVFEDTVAQGHTTLQPGEFDKVQIHNKELVEDAYIYVAGSRRPGSPETRGSDGSSPESAGRADPIPESGATPVTTNTTNLTGTFAFEKNANFGTVNHWNGQ